MSDQSLKTLLERINSDADFAERVRTQPEALDEFDLSTVELFALTCGDADALRRLVGETIEYRFISGYRNAIMAAFDSEVAAEAQEATASGKTSQVTSQTVTVCCWG